ncbi:MAG: ABC transporter permease subunit [Hydrogenibacillus sp.]|nr:ABC transporter permease subunit [Hydrogenibacillus sp.]
MRESLSLQYPVDPSSGQVRRPQWQRFGPLWTVFPASLWLVAFIAVPLGLVVVVSFFVRGTYGGIEYVFSLDNYVRLFDPLYVRILFVSLAIAFATTLITAWIGYPFAYIVARAPARWRSVLLMLIIVPFWTNSLIRTYAMIVLLRTEGVINTVLMNLGVISHPLPMMYNEFAVMVGMVYEFLPFMILPLFASIEKFDWTLLEAAGDLGARPWKAFLHVTLPLTFPGVIAGSLLVFIPSLGFFFIPDLLGGSKVMLISNLIKNQFLSARDWPFGAALSIGLIVITLILLGVYFRLLGNKRDLEVF